MAGVLKTLNDIADAKAKIRQEMSERVNHILTTKSEDYGSAMGELVDLVGAATGYSSATHIPENERHGTTRALVKLLRLMHVRAQDSAPNHESLHDNALDLIGEVQRMSAEVTFNTQKGD